MCLLYMYLKFGGDDQKNMTNSPVLVALIMELASIDLAKYMYTSNLEQSKSKNVVKRKRRVL